MNNISYHQTIEHQFSRYLYIFCSLNYDTMNNNYMNNNHNIIRSWKHMTRVFVYYNLVLNRQHVLLIRKKLLSIIWRICEDQNIHRAPTSENLQTINTII